MKIKFNRKMVMTGIISFLVIAASICFLLSDIPQ